MFNKLKSLDLKTVITWIVAIAAMVIGYNLLGGAMKILEFFGIKSTSEQAAVDKDLKDAIDKGYTPPKGEKETLPYSGWVTYANALYNDLKHSWIDDKYTTVYESLYRVRNLTDWNLFVKAFGLRQNYAVGVPQGQPMDLVSFLRYNLKASHLTDINQNYKKKGLNIAL